MSENNKAEIEIPQEVMDELKAEVTKEAEEKYGNAFQIGNVYTVLKNGFIKTNFENRLMWVSKGYRLALSTRRDEEREKVKQLESGLVNYLLSPDFIKAAFQVLAGRGEDDLKRYAKNAIEGWQALNGESTNASLTRELSEIREENKKLIEDVKRLEKEVVDWDYEVKALKAKIPRWIDVDDRLPNEGGRYWCYIKELNDLGWGYFQWNCYFDPQTKRFSDSTLTKGENVTHWMPLPLAPKNL